MELERGSKTFQNPLKNRCRNLIRKRVPEPVRVEPCPLPRGSTIQKTPTEVTYVNRKITKLEEKNISDSGTTSRAKHALGAFGPGADLSCLRQGSAPAPGRMIAIELDFLRRGCLRFSLGALRTWILINTEMKQQCPQNEPKMTEGVPTWSEKQPKGCQKGTQINQKGSKWRPKRYKDHRKEPLRKSIEKGAKGGGRQRAFEPNGYRNRSKWPREPPKKFKLGKKREAKKKGVERERKVVKGLVVIWRTGGVSFTGP